MKKKELETIASHFGTRFSLFARLESDSPIRAAVAQ